MALTFAVTLTGCTFHDIEVVEVDEIIVASVKNGEIKGSIELALKNPNSFPVTVQSAAFDIMLGEKKLGEAKLDESFKISANSERTYPVKLSADVSAALSGGLAGIAAMLMGSDPTVTLDGTIKARSFLFSKKVPVSFQTDLPISSIRGN